MFNKIKQVFRKRHDKQKDDPTLLEKMNRQSPEDQIELGHIVESAMTGTFGNVLNLIINGLIDEELDASRNNMNISADRVLGRVESLNKLLDRLEMCISYKKTNEEILREESSVRSTDSIDEVGPQAE